MELEHRGTKILEKLISVPPRLLETLEYLKVTIYTILSKYVIECMSYEKDNFQFQKSFFSLD